jgi:hypothetical protein
MVPSFGLSGNRRSKHDPLLYHVECFHEIGTQCYNREGQGAAISSHRPLEKRIFHERTCLKFSPLSKDDPVIESIRFITGDKLDNILSAYKAGKEARKNA